MKKAGIVMIGSSCIDEYYELEYVPKLGEKTICKPLGIKIGGMIGNAAAVAAAYGMRTYLFDTINNGPNTQMLIQDLIDSGINTDLISYDNSLREVKCLIFLKDGERIIYVIPTEKRDLILQKEQIDILKEQQYIYTSIGEMTCFRNPIETIDIFHKLNLKLILDIEYISEDSPEKDWEIISRSDITFINSEGYEQISKKIGTGAVEQMIKNGCMVVLTKGSEGCTVYLSNEVECSVPAYEVQPVDTTGAGDTFNASFVYGLSQGWDAEKTARFANAAARSILHMGARGGAVPEELVYEFMKTYHN